MKTYREGAAQAEREAMQNREPDQREALWEISRLHRSLADALVADPPNDVGEPR